MFFQQFIEFITKLYPYWMHGAGAAEPADRLVKSACIERDHTLNSHNHIKQRYVLRFPAELEAAFDPSERSCYICFHELLEDLGEEALRCCHFPRDFIYHDDPVRL